MLGPRTQPRPAPRARRAGEAESGMQRGEEALFVFSRYDVDNSGTIDVCELANCFSELGYVTGRKKNANEMKVWVERQLKKADINHDGVISREEFVDYYNKYVAAHRRQFSETYELDKGSIGKGAFATVLRAKRLTGEGGLVAIKKISKTGIEMELLHNEISIWEKFHHPSLLKLLDVSENDTHLMLVTELMTGGDLHQSLKAVGSFKESEAIALSRQIVSAVAYLHGCGVVHCDLKPSNILIVAPEEDKHKLQLKIADFGLSQMLVDSAGSPPSPSNIRGSMRAINARAVSAGYLGAGNASDALMESEEHDRPTGRLSTVCGTPEYFAPELVELAQGKGTFDLNAGYDTSVDYWAVGVIIYELLAGQLPFYSPDEDILFYKITENVIDFSAQVFQDAPTAVELIRSLTKTKPEERASCDDALRSTWLSEQGAK